MIDLTEARIAEAVAGDAQAAEDVIRAMEGRIQQRAWRTDESRADDLAQEGRVALWLGLRRFEGSSVAEFFTFADTTLRGEMTKARQADQRQGVSTETAMLYERCLRMAGGDPMEAERLACDGKTLGRRNMSPERALEARLSWQGVDSLDAPANEHQTVGDRLTYASERERISDAEREAREAKREEVRDTLGALPHQQEALLSCAFGIGDYPFVGGGDLRHMTAQDYADVAEITGLAAVAVDGKYRAAKRAFESAYLGGAAKPADDGASAPTKTCTVCAEPLPLTEFYVTNKRTGRRMGQCKECKRGQSRVNRRAA